MANQFTATIPNQIVGYMNCGFCQDELPDDQSPEEYSWVQAGVTSDGRVQVWCIRHQATIALFDDLKALKRGFDESRFGSLN
jgi:hypothetical protein